VPTKKSESPKEPENSEVIQNEFEDIINQPKKSSKDPVQQLFAEDEKPKSSIDKVDLEAHAPSETKAEESREETPRDEEKTKAYKKSPQDDPRINEVPPEIILDLPEEAFHAETRPVKVNMADLNSVFQSVLSSPRSDPGNPPKQKPGSKPNLIEDTLAFMASRPIEETSENFPSPEPMTEETRQSSIDASDHSLGNRIIEEHVNHMMDQSPEDVRQGSSHTALEKTVREVLGEVAPKIIRQVIREEIETIKKTK